MTATKKKPEEATPIVTPECAFNAALVEAQASMSGVKKASKNQHHNYTYASSEDVIRNARAALSAHGFSVLAIEYRIEHDEQPGATNDRERSYVFGSLHATYRVSHAGGYSITCSSETPIIPGKGRPPDKAVATAKTYDLGYFLRTLLLIERVENDADPDTRNDHDFEPQARARPGRQRGEREKGDTDHARERAAEELRKYAEKHGEETLIKLLGPRGETAKQMWAQVNRLKKELGPLEEEEARTEKQEPRATRYEDRTDAEAGWHQLAADVGEEEARADLLELYGASDPKELSDDDLAGALVKLETKLKARRR